MAAGVAITTGPVHAQTASDVLYRVNAGGGTVADSDAGPDWTPPGSTSGVSLSGDSTHSSSTSISLDSSVSIGTPTDIFQTEVYGDQQWTFSDGIQSGEEYEVRLYFSEIFHGVDDGNADGGEGDRVFDVAIEGQQVLDDYDIYADVGSATGVVKTFTVTPTDDTIDVDFTTETDNAKISAIEIVPSQPEPDTLGGPEAVEFGTVVTGESETETVTLTNLGESGDPDVDVTDVSIAGADAGEFSHDFSGSTTLAPGDSVDVQVTFSPSDDQTKSATLDATHSGSNSPLSVDLTGEGASDVPVGFQQGSLQGFGAGSVTAVDFGPDGRLYASTQGGTIHALNVTRNGPADYEVDYQKQIDAIKQIPNHDDNGVFDSGETNRQVTGLTVTGTPSTPVVYVSSSDPTIDVGTDDDDTDTNSGAISRLTLDWGDDGELADGEVDHDVLVLGLPRSEENHATNGIDLSPDGDTLYVAEGGHTNKGAPGDNFGHTPEYALSAATLEIDLAAVELMTPTSLQSHSSAYPDLDYYYTIPTVQGGALPFGGDDGLNQGVLVPGGPVQIWSPGYRNPYDLTVTEAGLVYVTDNGPNGGWGGQPADASGDSTESAADVTNHPNEDGSYGTSDQVHLATKGHYAGHAAPIRANPDDAGLYFANETLRHDFDASDSPVPFSMADPRQANYVPSESEAQGLDTDDGHDGSLDAGFGPLGGIVEYRASNFGDDMQGDLLAVEFFGATSRLEMNATGEAITDRQDNFLTANSQMPGITAQDDDEVFPGTVWTSWSGIAVFEPDDYGDVPAQDCEGADDASLDEDGDGYDNADEIDAGTDPCSSASTPHDFDGDGTSDLNDPDDDDDGVDDAEDPFAVDPDDGTTTSVPVDLQFEPNSHPDTILDLGFTGHMTNGEDDYQDLYDPDQLTAGGAANVLTVEDVPPGDAHQSTNSQQYAFQYGVDAPSEPFTVHTTVSGFPESPENFQSTGLYIGNGDQDDYLKLVVAANGGTGGIEYALEEDGSFSHPAGGNVDVPAVTGPGNSTDLSLTVFPSNDTVHAYYTPEGGQQQFFGEATIPASWLDSSDGNGLAAGVISTSFNAGSTFDASWTHLTTEFVDPPAVPVSADAGTDQTVAEGDTVTLDASGSTGDDLSYSWAQIDTGAPLVTLQDADTATSSFTAPDVDGDQTLTFEVEVSNGTVTDEDTVDVTVQDTDIAAGEVLHRVNAGGTQLTGIDEGPDWSTDTASSPSTFLVDPSGSDTYDAGDEVTSTDDVPDHVPDAVFDAERWDEPDDGVPLEWEFPVADGQDVEVRLYFGNQFTGTSEPGDRQFNVSVEGAQVLTQYDPVAEVGHANGTMESVTVTSDGTVDVDFAHGAIENPMVNAIEIVALEDGSDGDLSVAEAVASQNDPADQIDLQEIQLAINWWATEQEVPDTGGETIGLQQIQQLINTWATGGTIGDGDLNQDPTAAFDAPDSATVGEPATFDASASSDDGTIESYEWAFGDGETATGEQVTYAFDAAGTYEVELTVTDDDGSTDNATQTVEVSEASEAAGAASVSVTPESDTEASTYPSGAFQVENTAEQNITSIEFDLTTTAMPDMVWDPDGTAGDQAAKGLNIDSESGDGVGVVSTADDDVFSAPHNGVDGDDGYDVLAITFDDFGSGESFAFSADNDPTSIKGATITSQEAGPVSGLELARSTVTVEYADGSTQQTQLFGDGSVGGSQGTLAESVSSGPTVGVEGVSLDDGVLRDHHSAATVAEADQTVTITGEPGGTVTLLHHEAELELDNVPEYDGTPGYDIESYEANKIEQVDYQTVTLDSNGEATVDVTLLNSTDVGGYNHFVATHGDPVSDTGLVSNTIVLKLVESVEDIDNAAPTVGSITDAGVSEGSSESVAVSASDPDGDSLELSVSGPDFVSLTDDGDGTGTIDISPQSDDTGTHTVTVTADDGQATASEDFAVYVDEADQDGAVVFAVNAGGSEYAADGTTYQADTNFDGGTTFSTGGAGTPTDPDIGNTDDDTLYQTERYGGSFGYDIPVSEDGTYEVTLQFAEIYQGVSSNDVPDSSGPDDGTDENDRLFDVAIEGQQVLSEYDIFSEVGPLNATEKTYTVEVTDETLNVDFSVINDNAKISAIRVEQLDGGPSGSTSADIAVTADSGIDASTFSGGSLEVTNTGDQQISSITFDVSESLIPDAVFDPQGTAGDASAKGLVIDDESGDGVGVVSTADDDVFSAPHNGVDGDDGYDVMTIEFDDFEAGESFAFSVDMDPTTIKDASTTGGAGAVSGLEIAGSEVAVTYTSGSTQTTNLFGDGSDGGAQATTDAGVPATPTIGVAGVSLQSTDFPAHEAAAVGDSSQTITLSGPTDSSVELLHVEASEPPPDGYDVDEFEADNAESVSYQSVTLDSEGEGTIPVSLSESNLNYFVAAVEGDDGDTGETSNTVVLNYSQSAGEPQVLHRVNAGEGTTLSALDDGPDWTGVSDTSSQYLVSVAATSSGNYCGGDDVTPTNSVPSSTPDAVFDCERYGNSTWAFDASSGTEVEVRLYFSNQFPGADQPGDREFNVSVEGEQVLTQYDPVADVGHANGTMESITVTSDGTVDVVFEQGAIENPQVNAVEVVANPDGGSGSEAG